MKCISKLTELKYLTFQVLKRLWKAVTSILKIALASWFYKTDILIVNKQPLADTPTVTRAVEDAIAELKLGLPKNIKITVTFRQEDFIEASIDNVRSALIEGSIIVALILIPFLMDWPLLWSLPRIVWFGGISGYSSRSLANFRSRIGVSSGNSPWQYWKHLANIN